MLIKEFSLFSGDKKKTAYISGFAIVLINDIITNYINDIITNYKKIFFYVKHITI